MTTVITPEVILSESFEGEPRQTWHWCGDGRRVWHLAREIEDYPLSPAETGEIARYVAAFGRYAMGDA